VTESEFWTCLEYLACAELERNHASRERGLWCDGFVPVAFSVDGHPPHISGQAWVADHKRQWQWPFTLRLRRRYESRADVPWADVLPASDETGWLDVDVHAGSIALSPPPSRILAGEVAGQRASPKAGSEEDLQGCVELARTSGSAVEVLGAGLPSDRFVRVLLVLARRWGDPDHPGDERWRGHLTLPDGPLAAWDFENHAISLALEHHEVVLRWHRLAGTSVEVGQHP